LDLSIKVKLLIIFILISVTPTAVAVLYAGQVDTNDIKTQLFGTLSGVSKLVGLNFFDYLERNGRSVYSTAGVLSSKDPSLWSALIEPLKTREGVILYLVADSNGKVAAVTDPSKWAGTWAAIGSDISGKAFFSEMKSGVEYRYSESDQGKVYYSLPFNDSISNSAKPLVVAFGKQFAGTDGKTYYLCLISDWYSAAQGKILVRLDSVFGEIGSNVFTPTESGNQIWADTNSGRVGTFLQASAFGDAWSFYKSVSQKRPNSIADLSPDTAEYTLNGQGRFVGVGMAPSWYPYSLGFFAYVTNPERVYAMASESTKWNFTIAGGVILGSLVLAFLATRGISSSVKKVSEDAKKIASGDLR